MTNLIILNQILILGILVIIGVIAARINILTADVNNSISKLVFHITLPVLLFISISSINISSEIISNCIMVFILSFGAIFALYGAALLSAKFFKLDDGTKKVHLFHTMFGNAIFLGYPFIKSIYGEEGLLYAVIFQLVSEIILRTYGIFILNKTKDENKLKGLKTLINPCLIAFIIGFVLMIMNVQLPYFITSSLGSLGQTTMPLSMLYIGGMLAFIDFKGIFKNKYVLGMSINKMIISPILIFLLLFVLNKYIQFKIGFNALSVIIIQVGMPATIAGMAFCKKYECDDKHAAQNIFLSTILSFITLPIIYFFINFIYKT